MFAWNGWSELAFLKNVLIFGCRKSWTGLQFNAIEISTDLYVNLHPAIVVMFLNES